MKNVMTFSLVMLLAAALQLIQAQNREERKLKPFSKVHVFGDLEVRLEKSDSVRLVIESDNISTGAVETKNDGTTLIITMSKGLFKDEKKVKIKLYYSELRELKAEGSAAMAVDNVVTGDKIDLMAYSGGSIAIETNVNMVEAKVAQGSLIDISGKTNTQEVSVNTGGTYAGYDLESKNAYVKSNTKATAKVRVSEIFEGNANTGGWIGYIGKPKNKKTAVYSKGLVEEVGDFEEEE